MSAGTGESPYGIETVTLRAEALAREQGHAAIRPLHLTLAVMAGWDTPWPELIVERGGLSYRSALRRLGWKAPVDPPGARTSEGTQLRSSMRLTLLIAVVVALVWLLGVVRRLLAIRPRPGSGRLELSAESAEVMRLKDILAGGAGAEPGVGHLLLALASRPGEHLKVLPGATVLACDLRKRLGLATVRHRLILACDRPKLVSRHVHMRIDREYAKHGRWTRWGLARILYGAAGAVFAIAIFPVTVLATALLYLFLLPAALLMAGARVLCGAIVGCDARSYRWLKIPGGDVALTPTSQPASPRAVVLALLAPRMLAALVCVAAMTMLFWRSVDLGVAIAPIIFRRPDLVTGAATESLWLGPLSISLGMLEQNGTAAGIGLLAGLGAGVMSIPTFREVELIRLHAGHETGEGSRFARAVTAPASLFTGVVSCVEAAVPFTGAPIYVTAYLVPLFFLALVAFAILELIPY